MLLSHIALTAVASASTHVLMDFAEWIVPRRNKIKNKNDKWFKRSRYIIHRQWAWNKQAAISSFFIFNSLLTSFYLLINYSHLHVSHKSSELFFSHSVLSETSSFFWLIEMREWEREKKLKFLHFTLSNMWVMMRYDRMGFFCK